MRILRGVIIALLVVFGGRYFNSQFSSSGLLSRADDMVVTDGCASAMPLYDRAISFGAQFDGFIRRGNCRSRLKQYDGALEDWAEAIKIDPKNPAPHLLRADLLENMGRVDDALQSFDQAAALAPENENIRLARADFLRGIGRLDAAMDGYRELMAPANVGNAANRAVFEYAAGQLIKGDDKGAADTVAEGLKRAPDDALGLYVNGLLKLVVQGDAVSASKALTRSIDAGGKYRMFSILLNTGAAEVTHEPADKTFYYAYAEPFIPIAIEAILFLDVAESRAGQDGSDELRKNLDDIAFALRDPGSLFSAKLTGWPIPIVRFYPGEIQFSELLVLAGTPRRAPRLCAPRTCSLACVPKRGQPTTRRIVVYGPRPKPVLRLHWSARWQRQNSHGRNHEGSSGGSSRQEAGAALKLKCWTTALLD